LGRDSDGAVVKGGLEFDRLHVLIS
jgi:hypothetical protein